MTKRFCLMLGASALVCLGGFPAKAQLLHRYDFETAGSANDAVGTAHGALYGSATVSGDTITLPKLSSLVRGNNYRVEVAFTSGGADWVAWFQVKAER